MTPNINHFDELLAMALAQATPQHLLLVFVRAELPEDASAQQRQDFVQGHGGVLVPVFCVPLPAQALDSFRQLQQQASAMGTAWDLVFVAALSARPGQTLGEAHINQALDQMVAAVERGEVQPYLTFDPAGMPRQLV